MSRREGDRARSFEKGRFDMDEIWAPLIHCSVDEISVWHLRYEFMGRPLGREVKALRLWVAFGTFATTN